MRQAPKATLCWSAPKGGHRLFSKTELAWAAGFFDGEGTTSCYRRTSAYGKKKKYPILKMQVVQAEPTTLERFREALGGMGLLYGPYQMPSHKGKTTYYYSIHRQDDVQAAMLLLWPYLSGVKRKQIESAIEKYRGWSERFSSKVISHPS